MTSYTKTFKTPAELVKLLKSRGLDIQDDSRAERYIDNIGYYRLSSYMFPFLLEPKTDHLYKPGITFERILRLYRFDKKLRILLFNEIEKIEVAFRAAVVSIVAEKTADPFWMTNASFINAGTLSLIEKEYKHSTEDFIEHFKSTYSDPFPPAWILAEILPFGNITWIYRNLPGSYKKAIARKFYLQAPSMESWMSVALTRNSCCHHARVWNKVNAIVPTTVLNMKRPWIDPSTDKRRIYYNICIIKYFLDIITPANDFKAKINALLASFPEIDINAMGFNPDWENEPLWQEDKFIQKCAGTFAGSTENENRQR